MDDSKSVGNDLSLGAGGNGVAISAEASRILLLTGSNMSGKSTFLKSLGLNQILANMGAPVFAEKFQATLNEVKSCIRVSDSLADGYSYFYAEVLRLKYILDACKAKTGPCLFLIDEMMKGTNNRERLTGSFKYIEALGESLQIGVVATHDLELSQLAEKFQYLRNGHFREEIQGPEMLFHYTLKEGPSPTTNALEILRRAGLPV